MKNSIQVHPPPTSENNISVIAPSPTSFSPTSSISSIPVSSNPPPITTPGRHSRQSSTSSIYSNSSSILTPAPPTPVIPHHEPRGRKSSFNKLNGPSTNSNQQLPTKFTNPMSSVEIFDALEKEQEAIVNKLQREITTLKSERGRSRSQSTSSSSSISRNPSIRSIYSVSDAEDQNHSNSSISRRRGSRPSFGSSAMSDENSVILSLRKENESLKKKLADLSIKLTEKDNEIENLTKHVKQHKLDS